MVAMLRAAASMVKPFAPRPRAAGPPSLPIRSIPSYIWWCDRITRC